MASGVYKIKNLATNQVYFGSAVDITKRFNQHKRSLSKGEHHCKFLQNSWNKYGAESFVFLIVENCSVGCLIACEQFYIDRYKETGLLYNTNLVAGSSLGFKHTQEARKKLSLIGRGNTNKRGTKCSEETKRKMSLAATGKNNRVGKKHKKESIEKIRKAQEKHLWLVTDSEGNEYEVSNLTQFCLANNLHRSGLRSVVLGKQTNHKGYKCKKLR